MQCFFDFESCQFSVTNHCIKKNKKIKNEKEKSTVLEQDLQWSSLFAPTHGYIIKTKTKSLKKKKEKMELQTIVLSGHRTSNGAVTLCLHLGTLGKHMSTPGKHG